MRPSIEIVWPFFCFFFRPLFFLKANALFLVFSQISPQTFVFLLPFIFFRRAPEKKSQRTASFSFLFQIDMIKMLLSLLENKNNHKILE